jgi:prophage antirepressor-like protein
MEIINDLLFTYTGIKLIIVIDTNNKPWFNSAQVCDVLKYINSRHAIKDLVEKEYVKKLKNIVTNYKTYTYAQPNTKYLNEFGLYALLLRSRKKRARKFFKWIVENVIPSIRQKGYYELTAEYKKEIEKLNRRIIILENNQSRKHIKSNGQYIYILKLPTSDALNYNDPNDILKIGKTKRYNSRMNTYDTGTKDNVLILYRVKVSNAIAVENCLKGLLNHEVYRSNREHYKISLIDAVKAINECIIFTKTKKISEDKYYKTMNMSEEKQRRNIKFMIGGDINNKGSDFYNEYNKI